MSMLIIGVNPPKSCYVCSWYDKVDCPVNDGRYYYRVQRHPSCPLVGIPTPHGRLGDLDKLKAQYVHGKADDEIESAWISNIRRAITNAPTVIEAEGETDA